MIPEPKAWQHWPSIWLVTIVTYVILGKACLELGTIGGTASPFWLPTGLIVALSFIYGYRVLPGIFISQGLFAFFFEPGAPWKDLMMATGNLWEGAAVCYFAPRLMQGNDPLGSLRNFFAILAATAIGSIFNSLAGSAALLFSGLIPLSAFGNVMLSWSVGDLGGMLIVAPAIFAWWKPSLGEWQGNRLHEFLLLLLMAATIAYAIFSRPLSLSSAPLSFVLLPLLLWPALRFGSKSCTLINALVICIVIWGTAKGYGPFCSTSSSESLVIVQVFTSVIVFTSLLTLIVSRDRLRVTEELRQHTDLLEATIVERTKQLTTELAERKQAEAAREESESRANQIIDVAPNGMVLADQSGTIVSINASLGKLLGYRREELIGQPLEILIPDRFHGGHGNLMRGYFASPKSRLMGPGQDLTAKKKDGSEVAVEIGLAPLNNSQGCFVLANIVDVSVRMQAEQRIKHLAYRDSLTDLPNRVLLRDRVEQSISVAHREGINIALLFLDLDHFKNINDSLGHAVGDWILKEVAQRLSYPLREMDTVGRLGGDEFLIVLPGNDADAAAHVAQKLLSETRKPYVHKSRSLTLTPSIGIAVYPKDGTNFDDLLKAADTAMYRAKDEGRNAYRFYTEEMNQAVFQRMVLESNLHRAIENNEFLLHYQPKFDLNHQTLIGIEALVRWNQPEMGMISPGQFIPVAEASGLIMDIGKWVIEEACRQIRAWEDQGLPSVRVAVNFSPRQFAARNIVELVTDTLQKFGLGGEVLEMEITESLLAQDMEYTMEALQTLRILGIHVAVDDFGTGYSSLSYLKRFPIDRLKIDQSFVRDLETDPNDRAIATAVVTLGHSLGMRVIAEGVETAQQMEILRKMGCDEIQGYYLGQPMSADDMRMLLQKTEMTEYANN